MISVAYLLRFRKGKKFDDDINYLKKFYFSYCLHKAGVAHKLFILIKGPMVDENIKIIRKIVPLNIPVIKLPDESCDLGSFTEFACYRAENYMFILNQHSIIEKKKWLKIYYNTMKKTKSYLVALTASYSSMSKPYNYILSSRNIFEDLQFFLINILSNTISKYRLFNHPNYLNPCIRINAILVKTSIWLEYFNDLDIKNKILKYNAETGKNSFYNFLLKKKKKVTVVRSDGKYVTNYAQWKNFVPFRNSVQNSKLIISDNHTRFFENSTRERKKILENETWS